MAAAKAVTAKSAPIKAAMGKTPPSKAAAAKGATGKLASGKGQRATDLVLDMQALATAAPEAAGHRAPAPSPAVAAATAAPSAAGKATPTVARPPSAQRAAAKRRKSLSSMDGDGPPKRPTAVDFPQRKPVTVLEFHLMAAREAAQKAREERIRRQPNAQLGFPSFRQEPPLYIPFQEGPPTLPTPPSTPVSLFPTHAVQQDLARPLPSLSQQRLHAAMLNQGCDIPAANQGGDE